jgi:hypothetical protein
MPADRGFPSVQSIEVHDPNNNRWQFNPQAKEIQGVLAVEAVVKDKPSASGE